ncbi:MAG: LamG-like jellyroll fold domain-containing protein [Bacteroidota bacterium]
MKHFSLLITLTLFNSILIFSQNLALDLQNTDSYVSAGSNIELRMTEEMTMEAWIYPTSLPTTGNSLIINKEGEYECAIFPDGTLQWAFDNDDPDWAWHNTGQIIPLNQWTHIAIVYNLGSIQTFINGVSKETYNGAGIISDNSPMLNELWIGYRQGGGTAQYYGYIDEVAIWNRAKQATEISSDWAKELCGDEDGLVLYYPFGESSNCDTTVDVCDFSSPDGTGHNGIFGQTANAQPLPIVSNEELPAITDCPRVTNLDRRQDAEVIIFPNPVNEVLFIEAGSPITNVQGFNLAGQKMDISMMDETSSSTLHVSIDQWPIGMYIIYVETTSGVNRKMIQKK